ncbi:MAG: M13 family metallopeptidase, partial [Gammaproteobacteria bacterium]
MRLTGYLLMGMLCAAPLAVLAAGEPVTPGATAADAESLHLNWLDKSVSPSRNFYEYANGIWQKDNPIPPAYARWSQFSILTKHNQEVIHQLLEDAAKNTQVKP